MNRPCLDCGELTRSGSRCSRCEAKRDARRGTTTERGYGSDHQKRAKATIRSQPWCSICGHPGSPSNPLTADHVVPVSRGGRGGPLRVACRSCNSRRGNATIL
ncbi:MAG: HNH endonuclease [Actinobacteria bacterium]|nr:HNH endonuclease [Actinomycetota bacterium]